MKEAYINCTGDNSRSGMRDKASVFDENQNIYMSPQVCKIKGSHWWRSWANMDPMTKTLLGLGSPIISYQHGDVTIDPKKNGDVT